jgi:type VI secretion system protein ImpL
MIDAAVKQKKDGGAFELRWTSGAITVAMGLKIVSSPDSSATANAPHDQGFRGMRLPETIVGASPDAAGAMGTSAAASPAVAAPLAPAVGAMSGATQ